MKPTFIIDDQKAYKILFNLGYRFPVQGDNRWYYHPDNVEEFRKLIIEYELYCMEAR